MPRPGPGFENQSASSSSGHTRGSVAVVGAGISGLAAAYRLKKEGISVTIFDSQNAPGGVIKSYTQNGFIWDGGANTMAENTPVVGQLIKELQLEDKQIFPRQQNKRFIVRDGKPVQLPTNPLGFLATKLLSTPAKLRMLAEPFIWKRRLQVPGGTESEESLGSFLFRHIGQEPVEYLADPFCAGTAGSDPYSLSVRHAFPQLWEFEKSRGSLFLGAIAAATAKKDSTNSSSSRKKKTAKGSFSFLGGMQTLPNAFADHIGRDKFHFNTSVQELTCSQHKSPGRSGWTVGAKPDGEGKKLEQRFDAVVVTAPFHKLQQVKFSKEGLQYKPELPPVVYQPMSVVLTAFRTQDVEHPLPGFGVLVPSVEQGPSRLQSIGTLFSSFMFPDRAPPGHVLYTTFIGGNRNRELALKSSEDLQRIAVHDLQKLVGVANPPVFSRHVLWKEAFPEYGIGYGKVLEAIKKLEKDLPGFYYAGNHRGGLAVGKAMLSGYDIAGQVISDLNKT